MLDFALLPVEQASQSVRLLEAKVDQGGAIQAHRLAVDGVVDRPASRLRSYVMAQERSGCGGGKRWREKLTHAAKTLSGRGGFVADAWRFKT